MPRGRHRGGHRHGGRHHRGGGGWWGPITYPYYGYPYYDDFLYRNRDPQVIVVDKTRQSSDSGVNWPTIAISVLLSAFMLMRR